jgi:UDP-glucuronate 4-epimerase
MAKGPILITGAAGFIGFHVARQLLERGEHVIGIDGMTPYYDVTLKRDRLTILAENPNFVFREFMLEDRARLADMMGSSHSETVIHLAAQAGVRYSLESPGAYVDSNVVGTFNLLEACRLAPPGHLLIASTSSVYGNGGDLPYREASQSSEPLSLYAATKKATEVMAHAYAHLHGLPTTAFRFFTVYGPWGRPDMALFKFTAAILDDREIEIYGHGEMSRDFTYVDDLVRGIVGLVDLPPPPPGEEARGALAAESPSAPFRIVNIGASQPIGLEEFVTALEDVLGRKARRKYLPMQPGDVRRTYADTSVLRSLVALPPPTPLKAGIEAFVRWYKDYYKLG